MIFKDDWIIIIIESLRDYPLSYYKRLSIIASTCITIILVIDTLTTRQILPYSNTSGFFLSFKSGDCVWDRLLDFVYLC